MKKTRMTIAAAGLAGLLILSAAAVSATQIAAELRTDIAVQVNGQTQTLKDAAGKTVYPLSYDGTVYLPVRALGQALDQDVSWNSSTRVVSVSNRERQPDFTSVDGAETRMAALEREIGALTPGATYGDRALQYQDYSARLQAFRADLDEVDDRLEDDFDYGRISYADYNALMGRVNTLEERARAARVALEQKTIADTTGYQAPYEQLASRLTALESTVKTLETKVADLKGGATYTERVKQYNALDKEISPARQTLGILFGDLNQHLREGSLTYDQYQALIARADGLDIRLGAACTQLEQKTIAREDSQNPGQGTGVGTGDYSAKIADLEKRVDQLVQNVYSYKPAQGASNNKQAYRQLDQKLEALDHEIDRLDDALEQDYHGGKLTSADYRALERSLERLENRLDDASDYLEDVLGYDD